MNKKIIASRVVCKTPIVGAIHSAVHTASLIGERFSIIHVVAPTTLKVSEGNTYYPNADIVWREDSPGNRYEQVSGLIEKLMPMLDDTFTSEDEFDEAFDKAAK